MNVVISWAGIYIYVSGVSQLKVMYVYAYNLACDFESSKSFANSKTSKK